MSGLTIPYALTDAEIAAVISAATIAGVYDPNGHLTDAGIAAAISSATVGAKIAGIPAGGVGSAIWGNLNTASQAATFGGTYAGSDVLPNAFDYSGNPGTGPNILGHDYGSLSGTWMCTSSGSPAAGNYAGGRFVRVS